MRMRIAGAGAVLAVAMMAWLSCPSKALGRANNDYAARFDRLDDRINGGRGYATSTNETGVLAGSESLLLQSYVEMYRATGYRGYLDKLVDQFDEVLKRRDDVRQLRDDSRKRIMHAWGSTSASQGKWHVWAGHTAAICLGPLDFVEIVRSNKKLRADYGAKANEYLAKIRQSMDAHDVDWREGIGREEGRYADPLVGTIPFEQQSAMGAVNIGLWRVTRDPRYQDKATRLAHLLKDRLKRTEDGGYLWSYVPVGATDAAHAEDISRAAVDVMFAVRCKNAGIVFDAADLRAFGETWMKHVRRARGEWANTVAGGGGTNAHIPQAAGRWLDVCPFQWKLYGDARDAYASLADEQATPADVLGLAKLARYSRNRRALRSGWLLVPARDGGGVAVGEDDSRDEGTSRGALARPVSACGRQGQASGVGSAPGA